MRRSILHVADVLKWADAHYKRTGRFPRKSDGPMRDQKGENWANIDTALRFGFRGFPGGWSLSQLLAEHRGHRNRKRLPKYTIAQILKWADAHHAKAGRWPISKSGPIANGETWCAVDLALRHGQRGLPGGSSLARLLASRRGVRNRAAVARLTVRQILTWADAHYKRTGKWPTARSGVIFDASGETWCAVDVALKAQHRAVRQRSSLARLLNKYRGVARR